MRKPLAPPKNTPVDDIEVRYRHQAMHLLCIAGLGGLPQISLSMAELEGLPLGLSLNGPRGADMQLLRLGRRLMPEGAVRPHAVSSPDTRTRESARVLTVDACQRCGEDLTDAACLGHERRTLIDIVFEKVVRHADAQIKHCARCHAETRACFPHQMPGPLQYGPGIKAYVVHLLIAQMLSLKRVAQSMHALIARTLSEATLLGYVAQLHHVLAEWERHAIERLLASPAMHVDETSLCQRRSGNARRRPE